MLRFASFPLCLALTLAPQLGCFSAPSSDTDCSLPPDEPSIRGLDSPYALGTRDEIHIYAEEPFTLVSSDPSVLRIDEVGGDDIRHKRVKLSFVGVGQASLRLEDEEGTAEESVQVKAHDSFGLLLSEMYPIPIGTLTERILLAGFQYVLVVYLDEGGRRLSGYGLAELALSPGIEECTEGFSSFELHCLSIEEPGAHRLELSIDRERQSYPFEAVLEDDIVDIEILQPAEEELARGTEVQIDIVGVTEDGTRVSSLHPRFLAEDIPYFGYFAYEYDPEVSSRLLTVEVLDEKLYTRFSGVASDETTLRFDCAAAGPGAGSTVPALFSVLAMALLIRLQARRRRVSRSEINEAGQRA